MAIGLKSLFLFAGQGKQAVLMSIISGEAVPAVQDLEDKEVVDECLRVLRGLFKEQVGFRVRPTPDVLQWDFDLGAEDRVVPIICLTKKKMKSLVLVLLVDQNLSSERKLLLLLLFIVCC